MTTRMTMRALFFALPLLLTGCSLLWPGSDDDGGHSVACTLEFVTYAVDVRLPDGSPADSVTVITTNERTGVTYGQCLDPNEIGVGCAVDGEPGRYVVYTDGQVDQTSETGDDVTVRGWRGDLTFEAAFRFSGGACHVGKLAGPESVTLR